MIKVFKIFPILVFLILAMIIYANQICTSHSEAQKIVNQK